MVSLQEIAVILSVLTSGLLAALALAQRSSRRLRWSFALGMLGFAGESVATLALLAVVADSASVAWWFRMIHGLGFLVPIPWAAFVLALAFPGGAGPTGPWRVAGALATGLALVGAGITTVTPPALLFDVPEALTAARLSVAGAWGVAGQLLLTILPLGGLEACLLTSKGDARWRLKYLMLGLGGIFLVRFYFLSQILLFRTTSASYLATMAATVLVGNLMVASSLARDRLRGSELTVSRTALYRSVVLGVLGSYLFVVGALGWLLNVLGVPEKLFWGSLIIFVSALGLAAVMLSEDVRWRVNRFIGRHFYRSKYDYRDQWISFTHRLASLLTVEHLAPQLLGTVMETVGTTRGALYLADRDQGQHHLAAAIGVSRLPPSLGPESALLGVVTAQPQPAVLAAEGDRVLSGFTSVDGRPAFVDAVVAVPLAWQGALTGFMLIGRERTGAPYTAEDLEFLATIARQAAGAIVTTSLSETLARSREFEAFHRLTSFVIHDLKNAVSALSMLSRNALDHFDDPEFQHDAIKTLSRTVERMQRLLAKLTAAPEVNPHRFVEVDLARLLRETATGLPLAPEVSVHWQLAPVPPIMGDPEALERVLENLIRNALEAIDERGEITLLTGSRPGAVTCAVRDSGCGMSPQFLRKSLFAPFASTKKGGWGIGLYQARTIVAAHHGRIDVESVEGAGTTFTLSFPPAPAAGTLSAADTP